MPVLDKAGELVSSIANSVLGKRKVFELDSSSTVEELWAGLESTRRKSPTPRRRRITESGTLLEEPVQPKRAISRRAQKKWLASGLYAGQPRTFDMRLTESKNKRKSTASNRAQPRRTNFLPLPMFGGERVLETGP